MGSSEFTRAKDYVLGQLLLGLEDTMDHMLWIGESLISRNRVRTVKEIIKHFERIKTSDVQRVAKDILDKRRFNLAVIGPLEDPLEKELNQLMGIR